MEPWCLTSDYPYWGDPSKIFPLVDEATLKDLNRFSGGIESPRRGGGLKSATWLVQHGHRPGTRVPVDVTLDVFAAAEMLGRSPRTSFTGGSSFGGASGGEFFIPVLDGGVYFEMKIIEDQYDNSLSFEQTLLICGPQAYRAILELLGFDTPPEHLPSEEVAMDEDDVKWLVDDLLGDSWGEEEASNDTDGQ
jgi:hypothetical protein